jgi:hypothetical protein
MIRRARSSLRPRQCRHKLGPSQREDKRQFATIYDIPRRRRPGARGRESSESDSLVCGGEICRGPWRVGATTSSRGPTRTRRQIAAASGLRRTRASERPARRIDFRLHGALFLSRTMPIVSSSSRYTECDETRCRQTIRTRSLAIRPTAQHDIAGEEALVGASLGLRRDRAAA